MVPYMHPGQADQKPAGPHMTRVATQPYQGLSIDCSFSGTESKDEARKEDYVELHGKTAWIWSRMILRGCSTETHETPKRLPSTGFGTFCEGKYAFLDASFIICRA